MCKGGKSPIWVHRDVDNVMITPDPPDALRSTCAVNEHDVSVPRVIIT